MRFRYYCLPKHKANSMRFLSTDNRFTVCYAHCDACLGPSVSGVQCRTPPPSYSSPASPPGSSPPRWPPTHTPPTWAGTQKTLGSEKPQGKVVMSGIQPTGVMHLGNFFGAVDAWIKLQHDAQNKLFIGIMDLHSLTGYVPPAQLRKNIIEMTACLLACGLDPKKVVLFQQSRIVHHAQLCWILGTVSTMPQLYGLQQYRDKASAFPEEEVPYGILGYPVLQAADVLLYKATHVPVGEDQSQNLNVVRSIASRFNNRYKQKYFLQPQVLKTVCPRLKSLSQPEKKMSKSDANRRSRIELVESPDSIRQSFKEAVVEQMDGEILFDAVQFPGVSNLLTIHATIAGQSLEQSAADIATARYSVDALKEQVAEQVVERFKPVATGYTQLMEDVGYVQKVLEEGTEVAIQVAEQTMSDVSSIVGFSLPLS